MSDRGAAPTEAARHRRLEDNISSRNCNGSAASPSADRSRAAPSRRRWLCQTVASHVRPPSRRTTQTGASRLSWIGSAWKCSISSQLIRVLVNQRWMSKPSGVAAPVLPTGPLGTGAFPRSTRSRRHQLPGGDHQPQSRRAPRAPRRASSPQAAADRPLADRGRPRQPASHASRTDATRDGGGGIRTRGPLARTPVFKTGAFDRSATPPWRSRIVLRRGRGLGTLPKPRERWPSG
jgi:hypothetical protein